MTKVLVGAAIASVALIGAGIAASWKALSWSR